MAQEIAYRWAYRVFAAVSLIVLASGLLLVFFYRPSGETEIFQLEEGFNPAVFLQSTHQSTTWIWFALLAAIVILEFAKRTVGSGVLLSVTLGVAIGVTFTGFLLPWDQLALNAVTVGTDIEGFAPVVGPGNDVQFVLLDGAEVSVSTFRLWFFVHISLGVLVLLPAVFVYRRGSNRAGSQ